MSRSHSPLVSLSLPLRKCGLKHLFVLYISYCLQSLPLRKCGLKHNMWMSVDGNASHFPCGSVDWNCISQCLTRDHWRHFPCGSVDWNQCFILGSLNGWSHFPCGSVDWNCNAFLRPAIAWGHFPCGSVDWNTNDAQYCLGKVVTSLAEVWIETRTRVM